MTLTYWQESLLGPNNKPQRNFVRFSIITVNKTLTLTQLKQRKKSTYEDKSMTDVVNSDAVVNGASVEV
jgi:hypothetical protein